MGALFFASCLCGQTGDLALTTSTGIASRSVRRGVERSTAAWQAALAGSIEGWRGHLWSNRPFDPAEPWELQSNLGYVWSIPRTVSVEVAGTHFWYVDPPVRGAAAHSFEANVSVTLASKGGLRWGIDYGYDIRFRSRALEGSVAYDVPLNGWGMYLECRTRAGYVTAKDILPDLATGGVHDAYSYFEADLRLPYRIIYSGFVIALDARLAVTRNQDPSWSPRLVDSGSRGWIGLSVSLDL